MNFRKEEFSLRVDLERQRGRFRTPARLAAAALVLALIAAAAQLFVYSGRADALAQVVRASYAEALPGQTPEGDVVGAMRSAVREAESRADFLGVYGGNLSALDVLTEIAAHVPTDVDVVLEDLRIDGTVVRIRGFARNVQTLDRLEAELASFDPFADVKISDIQDDARRKGYTFNLSISLGTGDGGEAA
jgi:type II secretory pathway component PulL